MKRTTIITIAFFAYFAALIGMYLSVEKYIESKDNRLRKEMHDKINELFQGRQQYVDVAYSGYKVGYEKVPIPTYQKPTKDIKLNVDTTDLWGSMSKRISNYYEDNYGKLTNMYRTHYLESDWDSVFDYEDGWNLVILEHDDEGVYKTIVFPYAVGYFKQDYYFGDFYLPSVASAVNGAFEFYTTNNKSPYYGSFEKGCFDRVWSQIYDANNEYYYMAADKTPRFNRMGRPLFEKYPTDGTYYYYQNGFMYNGFYKVFIAATQPQTYTIMKWESADEQDKKDLWKNWAIGLTVLMLLVVIPLWVIEAKHQKVKDEPLYDKLKRLCNPANFIKGDNYDKAKVDKANAIYKRLMEITAEDKEALDEIQQQAVADLGIGLIDSEKLADLKEKVNPKNYLNPYDAEKVALANELFAILSQDGLTYNEFDNVEKKSKQL
ncbi:MAG: hypothetical protein QMB39_03250 [Bacteroidales bacterium]